MSELTLQQLNGMADFLRERLNAYTVVLFGSAASGRMRSDSDVDVSYLSDRSFSGYELFMHSALLAEMLSREVDLVDFHQASPVFRAQIIGTGRILLDTEPVKRQVAFMRALKEYAKLNEERAVVLEKLGYGGGFGIVSGRNRQQIGNDSQMHAKNP